ncbi:hypothetical protein CYFUS_004981 [Cystobacter fuscus]|uniref:Uncharacterized protein n=1 Tax=Cystobacter fuscus TaxID=43 RepID=A0A250J7P0_9BACT|nr:hypothetical protein [Cystobacter fuscus]ATB39537.1 hypothetical protein CYFUS_004981 [Cystobacter fuscus]WNG27096.1 hypothetical protein F0U62_26090 [Cystobacter fuscus]
MSVPGIPVEVQTGFLLETRAERDMLAQAPAEMRPFLEAQMKMAMEMKICDLLTRLFKSDHEQAMTVIKNTGG